MNWSRRKKIFLLSAVIFLAAFFLSGCSLDSESCPSGCTSIEHAADSCIGMMNDQKSEVCTEYVYDGRQENFCNDYCEDELPEKCSEYINDREDTFCDDYCKNHPDYFFNSITTNSKAEIRRLKNDLDLANEQIRKAKRNAWSDYETMGTTIENLKEVKQTGSPF